MKPRLLPCFAKRNAKAILTKRKKYFMLTLKQSWKKKEETIHANAKAIMTTTKKKKKKKGRNNSVATEGYLLQGSKLSLWWPSHRLTVRATLHRLWWTFFTCKHSNVYHLACFVWPVVCLVVHCFISVSLSYKGLWTGKFCNYVHCTDHATIMYHIKITQMIYKHKMILLCALR